MRSPWTMLLLAALTVPGVVVSPSTVAAQEEPLPYWTRVRVSTVHGETLEGRWEDTSVDSLRLRVGSWSMAIPLDDVERLERSAGIERTFDAGRMVLVAGGFAAAGGFLGHLAGPCQSNEFLGCMFSPTTEKGAIQLGAGIGFAFGLVVGYAASKGEREAWRPVPTFGDRGGSLEVHPFVGPRSGVAFSFRPGRR